MAGVGSGSCGVAPAQSRSSRPSVKIKMNKYFNTVVDSFAGIPSDSDQPKQDLAASAGSEASAEA